MKRWGLPLFLLLLLVSGCQQAFGDRDHLDQHAGITGQLPDGKKEQDQAPDEITPKPLPAVDAIEVVSNAEAWDVMVNKYYRLPENYRPDDLVYPDIPFIFEEMSEKRMVRQPVAEALVSLFDAAKQDGIFLAGVSAFRSEQRQKALYDQYVARDGEEAARTYSAYPGTSEHQTGLAIDVSGSTGACAVKDCFADTDEAKWLANHAYVHGFIIRYPKGKEALTGYNYEPWHLRFVGEELAALLHEEDWTLEEYREAEAADASETRGS